MHLFKVPMVLLLQPSDTSSSRPVLLLSLSWPAPDGAMLVQAAQRGRGRALGQEGEAGGPAEGVRSPREQVSWQALTCARCWCCTSCVAFLEGFLPLHQVLQQWQRTTCRSGVNCLLRLLCAADRA